jgi:hypothetical protein
MLITRLITPRGVFSPTLDLPEVSGRFKVLISLRLASCTSQCTWILKEEVIPVFAKLNKDLHVLFIY